jgi:cation:H+ antiporter
VAFIIEQQNLIFIVGGLLALFFGGECLIRGAVALADKLGLPKLLIGLTVVGFGTSMPELMVSLQAASQGAPDVAVGNIIGSNTANILLIAGLGALVTPMVTTTKGLRRDVIVMVMAAVALVFFASQGVLPTLAGQILFVALVLYIVFVFIQERKLASMTSSMTLNTDLPVTIMGLPKALAFVVAGLGLLIFGAHYLVIGATQIATSMGVSQAVIGLTLVALGTSLPELTVSLMSALKRENEVGLGNVIGSNIFNILGILGLTAMIHPLTISPAFLKVDLVVMSLASLWLAYLIFSTPKVGRLAGFVGVVSYSLYMAWLALGVHSMALG